ncbi:MAG: hypothetical protein ILNGONEN_00822 [Syntrophorhabdaceae bacterium]|nr:hypothetical protein [Syntrophorhabdaceae bacterium]
MRKKFVFQFGDIDIGWAFGLAAFAGEAKIEHFLQARRSKIWRGNFAGERGAQGVGAAAGGMLFVARRHVGRAHRAAQGFTAGADAGAHFHRTVEAAVFAKMEMRGKLARFIRWINAQIFCNALGGDNFAWIHQIVRIERALQFDKGLIQLRAEKFFVQITAHQAVAVLAAPRAAVFDDQRKNLFGNLPQNFDIRRGFHIKHRPHMQHADAGMAINRQLAVMAPHDLDHLRDVIRQHRRWNARIFDERDRLRIAFHALQNSQTGFAHVPDAILLFRRKSLNIRIAKSGLPQTRLGRCGLRLHFRV